jgi:hypothetical protein
MKKWVERFFEDGERADRLEYWATLCKCGKTCIDARGNLYL